VAIDCAFEDVLPSPACVFLGKFACHQIVGLRNSLGPPFAHKITGPSPQVLAPSTVLSLLGEDLLGRYESKQFRTKVA